MRFNKTILAVAVSAISMLSYGQTPVFNWGAETKLDNAEMRIDRYIAYTDDAIYAVRESGSVSNKQVHLLKYNKNDFSLAFDKDINTSSGVMGNSYSQSDVFFSKSLNKTLVTGWSWNKDDQMVTAGVHVVGVTGVWSQDARIDLIGYKAEKLLRSGNVEFNVSEDGSKLIVLCEEPTDKEQNERIKLAAYNTETWDMLWSKDITYDLPDANFKRNEVFVDNEGNGFVVKKNKVKLNNYSVQVYRLNAADQSWTATDIDLGENQLLEYKVVQPTGKPLKLVGLIYPNGKSPTSPCGFVHIKMTADNVDGKHTLFPQELCTKFMPEKRYLKGKTDLSNMNYRGIVTNDAGDVWFFLEEFTESKTSVEGQMGVYKYNRVYKDGLVIKTDNDGTYNWSGVLRREQKRTYDNVEDDYGHYQYAVVNNKAYIIWNLLNQETSFYAWKDKNGAKMKTHEVFGSNAQYPVFFMEFDENGINSCAGETFDSRPMIKFFKGGFNYTMVNIPELGYSMNDRIMVYTELYPTKLYYRMGSITFE